MISASFLPVSAAMSATASLIVPMSPFFVLPGVTPQSIRMCCGPSAVGTVNRKKSPNPTRYMRMRSSPFFALLFFVAMSESSVNHGEIDCEAVAFILARHAEVFGELPLAIGAFAAQVFRDHVADRRLVCLRSCFAGNWAPDDERGPAPQRERPELRRRIIDLYIDRLHRFDHHVRSQAAVRIDTEDRVERGNEHR